MSRLLRHSPVMVAALALPVLVGCATRVSLTKEAREATRSVSIKETVTLWDQIVFMGPAQSTVGVLLGPIGMLMTEAKEPKAALKIAAQEFDLGQMVRRDFTAALEEAKIFPTVVPEGGDAQFTLEIREYACQLPTALPPVEAATPRPRDPRPARRAGALASVRPGVGTHGWDAEAHLGGVCREPGAAARGVRGCLEGRGSDVDQAPARRVRLARRDTVRRAARAPVSGRHLTSRQ